MTISSTKELFAPFKDPKREFRSSKKHFKTLSLDESRSPNFDLFSDQEEYLEEKVTKTMVETMEQYISKTRAECGSRIARPKIEDKDSFELKGQFLKELRDNTFSGSDHEDANEHIEKVFEIVDLFHVPNITINQVMLRAFSMSLTGAASHWLRNKLFGSITTWEDFKTKFLSKYCPPARTAKKMEEINKFQQEADENLYRAWERFKELLMKQILDSRGAIPSKTAVDAKVAIQEMAEYAQKWHNRTSRTRSTKTSDRLAAIQAQLNNLRREIKKERGFGSLPSSIETNPRDHVKSISTIVKADSHSIRRMGSSQYTVSTGQNRTLMYETKQTAILFLGRLNGYYYEEKEESYGSQFLKAYSYGASHNSIPTKEKDLGSFTLPCFINNYCFNNALADLGASVSVMPLSTYLNLGLGKLAHTKLTVELEDRTVKYPKGIAENVLLGLGERINIVYSDRVACQNLTSYGGGVTVAGGGELKGGRSKNFVK
nr:hypothetical protein [Tanacetum cinerariifolium]